VHGIYSPSGRYSVVTPCHQCLETPQASSSRTLATSTKSAPNSCSVEEEAPALFDTESADTAMGSAILNAKTHSDICNAIRQTRTSGGWEMTRRVLQPTGTRLREALARSCSRLTKPGVIGSPRRPHHRAGKPASLCSPDRRRGRPGQQHRGRSDSALRSPPHFAPVSQN
jgi:hypothetical protein